MSALRYTLLVLHFIGLAAILGPFLDQLRADTKRITTAMVWGARAQIITGLALVGVAYASDHEPDHVKIAVKLVIALAIAGIAESMRKKTTDISWAYWTVGALTIVNIAVAVAWR
jgi:Na+-transporting NADH:ubiquinone oxidoreductase subunit NqrD